MVQISDAPPPSVPTLESLGLSRERPLLIVDVDEVLGLFMRGFGDFIAARDLELRVERFALFKSIFRPGETDHLPTEDGRELLAEFFRSGCGEMEPTPGAMAALEKLGKTAEIIILSNAPPEAEVLRRAWLRRHGVKSPLILNNGPKGPITAGLTLQTSGRTAFVDDLLPNLDSVAAKSPATATFQHVADERLRPLAPCDPEKHRRIDDWAELADAIEASLRV